METLLTSVAFLALTIALMAWHARRSSRRRAAAPSERRACPRCAAPVAGGAEICPACGVPLQAYEIVAAPEAEGNAAGAAAGRLHAMVRSDTCVGCGACVPVCPEPGAIRLDGKVPIIDTDLCMGHGECVKACPTGGILLSTGAAVQRLEVPFVSPHFETNIFGLYVVGELGGRGLIKNAVNEGKIAMEHVVQRRLAARGVSVPGVYDVIIVGSGPAGLSAGLAAHQAGLSYLLLEQGSLSDTIHRYPRHKLLLAEPVRMPMYGDLWVADTSKESLLAVWRTIIERTGLEVRTGCRVSEVVKRQGILEVQAEAGVYRAHHVVLAMGRRGTPRRLGVPGEDLPKVFYDIVEMEAFAGARALVVGGGDSAVESAVGLANQHGTDVTLSYRGEDFARAKDRNRAKLEAEASRGRVRLLLRSQLREIRPGEVSIEVEGTARSLANDYVIVRIGGDPPHEFLRRAGVRIIEKEIALTGGGAHAAA
jgi:thioredoxin reductase/NAD-dependent dihydropyrimidine dehydrogenase PreA subunit